MKATFISILISLSLISYGQNDLIFRHKTVLGHFRDLYNSEQYDSLYSYLARPLQSAISPQAWSNMLSTQLHPDLGKISPFVFEKTVQKSWLYYANADSSDLAMEISLDSNLSINGIHIVPAKSEKDLVRPQTPVPPFPYTSENVEYTNTNKSVHFSGTFTYPSKGAPFVTILLITGSGIQDRDETVFGHKPFAVIADFLTRKGYAVLRVDDRGAGGTSGKTTGVTSEDFADDAKNSLQYLASRQEPDKTKIGLLGHSEGGLIAAMVASKEKKVDFIILWGAPFVGGIITNTEQNARLLKSSGMSTAAIRAFSKLHTQELSLFKNFEHDTTGFHKQVEYVFTDWKNHQPDSILQTLKVNHDSILGKKCYDIYFELFEIPWMNYFITHDFKSDLEKVKCNVLAINGSKDTQVAAEENLQLISKLLRSNGNKSVTTIELKGLNHLLQTADTGDYTEYSKLDETISPLALNTISDWLATHILIR